MAFKSHKDAAASSLVFRGKAADLEAIANLLLESKALSGRVSGQIISRGKVVKVIKRRRKRSVSAHAVARNASLVSARQKHLQKTREARAQMVAHITPQVADAYAKANPAPSAFWNSAE